MTHQPPKKERSGSVLVGTCDWCKEPVKNNEKRWRGLLFHSDCYKYGKKIWKHGQDQFPARNWREKSGGEQASSEETMRRIKIMGKD